MKDYDMLAGLLDANVYDYVICNVSEIIYDENAEQPYIFVSTEDFCKVINKQAPYVSFDIIINSGVESRDYAKLREAISEWAAGNTLAPKVTAKGSYVDYLLRKNANYSTIMMLISMLVPLIIPFIWYYPLSTLFDRRRAELQLLRAFGKKRGQIRRSFALEGILVSTAAFVSVLLMCYPAMFIFKQVCKWCKLPLTFEYGNLTLTTVILAAAFSALCAAVSFAVCYALAVQRKQTAPK
jgi:ABC-type lipoprotein release transport system permease subunit